MAKAEDDKGTDETKDNGSVRARARARARGVTRTKASEAMTKTVEELVYPNFRPDERCNERTLRLLNNG